MKTTVENFPGEIRLCHWPENKADEKKLIAMVKDLHKAGHDAMVEYKDRSIRRVIVGVRALFEPEKDLPERPEKAEVKPKRNPDWVDAKYDMEFYGFTPAVPIPRRTFTRPGKVLDPSKEYKYEMLDLCDPPKQKESYGLDPKLVQDFAEKDAKRIEEFMMKKLFGYVPLFEEMPAPPPEDPIGF